MWQSFEAKIEKRNGGGGHLESLDSRRQVQRMRGVYGSSNTVNSLRYSQWRGLAAEFSSGGGKISFVVYPFLQSTNQINRGINRCSIRCWWGQWKNNVRISRVNWGDNTRKPSSQLSIVYWRRWSTCPVDLSFGLQRPKPSFSFPNISVQQIPPGGIEPEGKNRWIPCGWSSN